MTEREKMQQDLELKRALRAEFDGHMKEARSEVCIWLQNVSDACLREEAFVAQGNYCADGEIAVPYGFLQDAINRLRAAKDRAAQLDRDMEEMVQQLADEEVWK